MALDKWTSQGETLQRTKCIKTLGRIKSCLKHYLRTGLHSMDSDIYLSHPNKRIINSSISMRMKLTKNLKISRIQQHNRVFRIRYLVKSNEKNISKNLYLTSPTTLAHFLYGFLDDIPNSCIAKLEDKIIEH